MMASLVAARIYRSLALKKSSNILNSDEVHVTDFLSLAK